MTFTATVQSSTKNLERVRDLTRRAGDVVRETIEPRVAPRLTRVAQEIIGRDPGPVKYLGPNGTLRWKSDNQRKFVMRMYRLKGIKKYTRTGAYRKGYQVFVVPSPDGFLVVLRNETPAAAFVGGIWQQPFHQDTGWAKVSDVQPQLAQVAELEISLILDEFWSSR